VLVHKLGGPEVLTHGQCPLPEPDRGQVRVRVRAAGINFADTEKRRGLYMAVDLPWIPGHEGAGVVEALGLDVEAHWLGRRVVFLGQATYAQQALADVDTLVELPDALSYEQAAALPVQGLTAYHLLFTVGRVRPGERVLVHAAAGGVGLLAVQLARRAGARVWGSVSSEVKVPLVRALQPDGVFLYGPALEAGIRAATDGAGVDLVLDSVGLDTQAQSLALLAPFGRLIHFGTASGAPRPLDPDRLYERSLAVGAYWLRTPHPPELQRQALANLVAWLADGSLCLPALEVLDWQHVSDAHARLETRRTMGKLVLRIPE
jgi:NADPH2:quinone reductase